MSLPESEFASFTPTPRSCSAFHSSNTSSNFSASSDRRFSELVRVCLLAGRSRRASDSCGRAGDRISVVSTQLSCTWQDCRGFHLNHEAGGMVLQGLVVGGGTGLTSPVVCYGRRLRPETAATEQRMQIHGNVTGTLSAVSHVWEWFWGA